MICLSIYEEAYQAINLFRGFFNAASGNGLLQLFVITGNADSGATASFKIKTGSVWNLLSIGACAGSVGGGITSATVDIKVDGSSLLSSAIDISTQGSFVAGVISTAAIASGKEIVIEVAAAGADIDEVTVELVFGVCLDGILTIPTHTLTIE